MHSALAIAFAALASASPIVKGRQASAINDGVILNYALSLEHLENTFYREALAKFSEADFAAAGLPASFYHNLMTIAGDEKTHVEFLTTALSAAGVTPVQECTYAFGTDDVPTFLAVANVLEGVGVSAYLGAAASIADKAYLTAAGSILTVESRHSAYLRENQSPAQSPFPSPFDIPLNFNQVFSLAAQFITACPQGDDGTLGLPFMPFPALAASPAGVAKPGDKIDLKAAMSVSAMGAYFITSTGSLAAPLTGSGDTYSITVPEGAQTGQAYLVLTKDMNAPTDDNVVAGPAVIQIADAAAGKDYGNGGGMPDGGMPDGGKPDGGKPEDYGSYGKYGSYGDYKDVHY